MKAETRPAQPAKTYDGTFKSLLTMADRARAQAAVAAMYDKSWAGLAPNKDGLWYGEQEPTLEPGLWTVLDPSRRDVQAVERDWLAALLGGGDRGVASSAALARLAVLTVAEEAFWRDTDPTLACPVCDGPGDVADRDGACAECASLEATAA